MLQTIAVDKDTSVEEVSRQAVDAWINCKVLHVSADGGSTLQEMEPDKLRKFYDEFLESIGVPYEIAEDITKGRDAPRTNERWMEIRYDPDIKDAYRYSPNAQPLHTDGSYVSDFPEAAIMYCQSSAAKGGATVFLDSIDLVAALEEENPELLKRLTSTVVEHSRSADKKIRPIIEHANGEIVLTWNYYCVNHSDKPEIERLADDFKAYLESSDKVASSLVAIDLHRGDCVIWKDTELLHGRNGFDPTVRSERFLWKSAVQVS